MDRETLLLLALGMLIAAALVVGVSGWVLVARDRHLAKAAHAAVGAAGPHAEAQKEP